jgi:hypothetical protein
MIRLTHRFLLTCVLLYAAPLAWSATWFVRAGGSDAAAGTSAQTAFRTPLRAAQAVNHGDTIVIGPGVYRGAVVIAERFGTDKAPLAVLGDESGARTGDPAGPVVLEATTSGEALLRIHRARQVVLSGLTLRGVGEGISLSSVRGARIERCSFDKLAKAINIAECEDVRVESCVITRTLMGLVVKNSTRTRLAHLTMASCSAAGVLLAASANGAIRNCLFVDNATNLVADVASAPSWSSDYNTFTGTMGSWGSVTLCRTPYEWFSISGQERHSTLVAPAFVQPAQYNLHIDPTVSWGGGLSGMTTGVPLDPPVTHDRDGVPLTPRAGRVGTGAYAYPEPVAGPGWKKLPGTLPAGVRQSAAIYTKDGTLARTLLADATGVRELWWDGRDDTGAPLPAGAYTVHAAGHDLRVLDDGTAGDNGNPLGAYNCDNAQRVVAFADGAFIVSTIYDEAGVPLRYYAATGQPVSGSQLADKNIWAIAAEGTGKTLIAGVGSELQRIVAPGERARMHNGADAYAILAPNEKRALLPDGKTERPFGGVAVTNGRALVSVPLAGGSVVRVFDLATGAKVADWPVPAAGDIDVDARGNAWVLCGTEVICLDTQGQVTKRVAVGAAGSYLAVGTARLAVMVAPAGQVVLLNMADGAVQRTLGKTRPVGIWQPVAGDLFRGLRDAVFLDDNRLLVCEAGRVKAVDLTTGTELFAAHSNFLDTLVPHPTRPEYGYYYGANILRIDHATGAWEIIREAPYQPAPNLSLAQCVTTGVVAGTPYLLVYCNDSYVPTDAEKKDYIASRYAFLDITDPLAPKFAGTFRTTHPLVYNDLRFDKDGNLCYPTGNKLALTVHPFLGKDANGYLRYTALGGYGKTDVPLVQRGPGADATPRAMFHKGGMTIDTRTNDAYLLACTPLHNKMVPAWGASGTGVGKLSADGTVPWFTESSGGNYTSISCVRDAKHLWVMAGKDTNGGAIDLYTADGLRVASGNAAWGANWTNGMVDIREGLQAYLRPDGTPGANVEDDNVGRFIRYRVEGTETLKTAILPLNWAGGGAPAGTAPTAHEVAGNAMRNMVRVPKVAGLAVDGDWAVWTAAGITPQIVSLPIIGWGRTVPPNLLQSYDAGTSIGAMAHDGKNVYVYFLTTDNTPQFNATNGFWMWEFDSIELWIEEEQFGLGFLKDGTPCLYKYRYHDRAGREWAANYPLPAGNIWGQKLADVATHPLGRALGAALGAALDGKPGYALMAKIPCEEIKLVGGIAGRQGGKILPMTGAPGEILRVGIAFDGITAWGREQDYKVYWPIGLMFSDPTTNVPFVLGE